MADQRVQAMALQVAGELVKIELSDINVRSVAGRDPKREQVVILAWELVRKELLAALGKTSGPPIE